MRCIIITPDRVLDMQVPGGMPPTHLQFVEVIGNPAKLYEDTQYQKHTFQPVECIDGKGNHYWIYLEMKP